METKHYMIAGHTICVSGEAEIFSLMRNYEPFAANHPPVIHLTIENGIAPAYTEELRQEDDGQTIICGKTTDDKPVFEFHWGNVKAGYLICSADYHKGQLIITGQHTKMAIDNAMMVLFALATANQGTVLFHAATVSHAGKAYMFLGPSGTGKSTHASLWLRYIEGTELVNDDNPVVRILPTSLEERGIAAMVYGSPWSGKTPCYRNVSYPLSGIVILSQAPYNKIVRLSGLQAFAALVASISGKRWDTHIANGLHQTENALASTIPVWHLECLPDKEAALLCSEELIRKGKLI